MPNAAHFCFAAAEQDGSAHCMVAAHAERVLFLVTGGRRYARELRVQEVRGEKVGQRSNRGREAD